MTFYRALGYVDRSLMADDKPLRVVMATEGRKADGIDLRMAGANLERYRANPVLGYGHNYYGRGNLPIGRVNPESINIEGDRLLGELEFDQGDEFAREVERKMRDGYLNAVSIGFNVTRWEDPKSSYWTGGVAVDWEMSELSTVPIGMDAKALATAGRSLADPELIATIRDLSPPQFEQMMHRLRALNEVLNPGQAPHLEPEPAPDDSVPAVPAIDQTAARNLLAAINLQGVS